MSDAEEAMEIAALELYPYDADPELAWHVPPAPGLPYDGEIPADVLELAERRRAARADQDRFGPAPPPPPS